MSVYSDLLAKSGLPKEATQIFEKALQTVHDLITENNKRVAQVNASKQNDPNNVEYVDSLWKSHAKSDAKMRSIEEQFDAVAQKYEELLSQLREFGKTKVTEPLSEDKAKEVRKSINESRGAIQTEIDKVSIQSQLFEPILKSKNVELPEGGIVSLLPQMDSLLNARGRKGSTGKPVMTRTSEVLLNGKSTQNKDGKANFVLAAAALSKLFGADNAPQNTVTAEELEAALFENLNLELRSKTGAALPEKVEFIFEKNVEKRSPNGEGFISAPEKVTVTYFKPDSKKSDDTETSEAEKTEPAKVEPAKNNAAPTKVAAKK